MQTNENENAIRVISGILAILMLIAIFNMPYGYYTFLRVATFVMSAAIIYFLYNLIGLESPFLWGFLIILILWNPIFPQYMDKGTWTFFNLIAFAYAGFVAIKAEL